MKLSVTDKFKIHSKLSLSGEDYSSLIELYMPIVGIDSHSLYLLLNNLETNQEYLFKKIIDSLNLGTLDLVSKAFSKLEAVALVDVYYNDKNGYLIVINNPLKRFEFLNNTILASFLRSQIGEVSFEKLNIDKTSVRNYKKISRSFDEVYQISSTDLGSIFNRIFKLKNKPTVKVENPDFDYIFFKMTFDTSFMDHKLLDDEEFKQFIITTSFTYQLNEEDMMEVIMKTITIDRDLKFPDISKNARMLYQKKYKRKEPKFVTTEADAFINSATDDETYQITEKLNSLSPADFLSNINEGAKASAVELQLIEDLKNNTTLSLPVIYILIMFVGKEKDGDLPGYNYFEKIANNWMRAKVKTPQDAINKINSSDSKSKTIKQSYNPVKKVASLPDWYANYEKGLENIQEVEDELSNEELEAILKKAKEKYN